MSCIRSAFFCLAAFLVSAASCPGYDTGWARTGVRAWYFGASGSDHPHPTPIAETYLLGEQQADSLALVQQSWTPNLLMNGWEFFTTKQIAAQKPGEEGPFWIHPNRLKPLQAGTGTIQWMGLERLVADHAPATQDTVPLCLLPARALFQLSEQRDIVRLKNQREQQSTEEYVFDVETGLLIYRTYMEGSTKAYLSLAEINYDFAAHRAYPEDKGMHTTYAGMYRAAALGNGMFQFYSQVQSRYGNEVIATLYAVLSGSVSATTHTTQHVIYHDGEDVARITDLSLTMGPIEQWEPCGDHWFWWMPPDHLGRNRITVWGATMDRSGVGTFVSPNTPGHPGFRSLTFDPEGFLTDLAVFNPTVGINVDSGVPCFQRLAHVLGRAEYADRMQRAIPTGDPVFGSAPTEPSPKIRAGAITLRHLPTVAHRGIPPVSRPAWNKYGETDMGRLRAEFEAAVRNIRAEYDLRLAEADEDAARSQQLREEKVQHIRTAVDIYMDALAVLQKESATQADFTRVEGEKFRVWQKFQRHLQDIDRPGD